MCISSMSLRAKSFWNIPKLTVGNAIKNLKALSTTCWTELCKFRYRNVICSGIKSEDIGGVFYLLLSDRCILL